MEIPLQNPQRAPETNFLLQTKPRALTLAVSRHSSRLSAGPALQEQPGP